MSIPKFRMWMRPDGVVQLVWTTGAVMTLVAAKAAIKSMSEITGGQQSPLLVAAADEAMYEAKRHARGECVLFQNHHRTVVTSIPNNIAD